LADYDTDRFIAIMTRVAKLEEEFVQCHKRQQQIDLIESMINKLSLENAVNSSQIHSALKTTMAILGIVFTLAAGFWSYHNNQTAEIEHQITQNNKVMHSTHE
jgi:hypothetical protein